ASARGPRRRAAVLRRGRRGCGDVARVATPPLGRRSARGGGARPPLAPAPGAPAAALARTIPVLVPACPHALGLAIPLVIAISTSLAAREGILVKDRLALERMRTVDAVLFDKTGTLTTGKPTV